MEYSDLQKRVLDELTESVSSTDPALATALSTFDLAPLDGRRTYTADWAHRVRTIAGIGTATQKADPGGPGGGLLRERRRIRVSAGAIAVVVLAMGILVGCLLPADRQFSRSSLLAAGAGLAVVALAGVAAALVTRLRHHRRALDSWPAPFERSATQRHRMCATRPRG